MLQTSDYGNESRWSQVLGILIYDTGVLDRYLRVSQLPPSAAPTYREQERPDATCHILQLVLIIYSAVSMTCAWDVFAC